MAIQQISVKDQQTNKIIISETLKAWATSTHLSLDVPRVKRLAAWYTFKFFTATNGFCVLQSYWAHVQYHAIFFFFCFLYNELHSKWRPLHTNNFTNQLTIHPFSKTLLFGLCLWILIKDALDKVPINKIPKYSDVYTNLKVLWWTSSTAWA